MRKDPKKRILLFTFREQIYLRLRKKKTAFVGIRVSYLGKKQLKAERKFPESVTKQNFIGKECQ